MGCNVENASYGAGICAGMIPSTDPVRRLTTHCAIDESTERTAMTKAVVRTLGLNISFTSQFLLLHLQSQGITKFVAVAVARYAYLEASVFYSTVDSGLSNQ